MEHKDNQTELEKQFDKDDTTPEISIIVNVRNCSEMLLDCIKSIKKQTVQNFEVLLADNGSDDGSDKLAEELAEQDDRFTYLKKSESGAGDCRNTAIQKAQGQYLSFIEGTDKVRPDFLENLYDAVNDTDSDIAVCGYCYYFPKKRRRKKIKPTIFQPSDNKIYTRGQALYLLLPDRPMRFFLWNKLFKKELFLENNITIPDMYYEEIITCTKLFYYANQVITLEDGSYLYTRPDKRYAKKALTQKHIDDYIHTVALIKAFLKQNKCLEIFQKPFLSHVRHVSRSLPIMTFRASRNSHTKTMPPLKASKEKLKKILSEE